MPKKKTSSPVPPDDPTPGELDVLAALWAAERPLGFGEIHQRVGEFRRSLGESPPATSTIGSFLDRLAKKNLIRETVAKEGTVRTRGPGGGVRTRGGMLAPKTRSRNLEYEALYPPGAVLARTYQAILSAYPEEMRADGIPLADLAQTMGLKPATIEEIKRLVAAELK